MVEFKDRQPPYDINVEAAVLSAMMIDPLTVIKSIELAKEQYFHRPEHKILFEAMRELFNNQSEVDPLTLANYLEEKKLLEKVGGKSYILQIADVVVSGANFGHHIKILYDKYLRRELIHTSNKIVEKSYEGTIPSDELLDFAENTIYQLSETTKREGFVKAGVKMSEVLQTIEDIMTNRQGVHGLATGFNDIDKILGGLRAGQLVVVAARPGVGKSAFVTNIALNTAMRENSKVAFFTMEMSTEEVITRMISAASEVPLDNLLKGYGMNEERVGKIAEHAEVISNLDLYFDDTGTNTSLDLRAKSRRLKAELGGLDLIIVDYLQLMSSHRTNENRQQEIAEISRSLKVLAKELSVPVIGLSQLNRSPASRDDNKPRLSDLRESGAIEQDADIVIFLYREKENKSQDPSVRDNTIQVSVAKNRQGRTSTITMGFFPEYTVFRDLETSEYGEEY